MVTRETSEDRRAKRAKQEQAEAEAKAKVNNTNSASPPGAATGNSNTRNQKGSLPQPEWPQLHADALHGLIGRLVMAVLPHTESDAANLLLHLLVMIGNAMGRGPYYLNTATRHYTNLFGLVVGKTSSSCKGTGADIGVNILRQADADWVFNCLGGGISSGEGIIDAVRDPVFGPDKKNPGTEVLVDPGAADKRLLINEREFANVFNVKDRKGNNVIDVLRRFWDGEIVVRTMTKNSKTQATNAHVSIVGHITPDELREKLGAQLITNGFANRFLVMVVHASKMLPFGSWPDAAVMTPLIEEIKEALVFARSLGEMEIPMADDARVLWTTIYSGLRDQPDTLTGNLSARAVPLVIRVAVIFAVLDRQMTISRTHLDAASMVWRYCEDSLMYLFAGLSGNPIRDAVMAALDCQRPNGMTTREILREVFFTRVSIDKVLPVLRELMAMKRVRHEQRRVLKGGTLSDVWFAM
jgi:hypothetical protein